MAETPALSQSRPLISAFSSTPVPNLQLSAAGLLALADLHTVAQRTIITGGSSWLDALVLAPGLHYQQAAEALDAESKQPRLSVVLESPNGDRHVVNNAAMAQYIRRLHLSSPRGLTLNISADKASTLSERMSALRRALRPRLNGGKMHAETLDSDHLSHVFYLASPVLTLTASIFMILLADWWGLAFIVALMISRLLNIYSIKQRTRPPVPQSPRTSTDQHLEYAIHLGDGARILLRGLESDIRAVTTQAWLRRQTTGESYLEAAAKLIVYLVAAFSGNQTQAGAMVLMALLIVSAGLLGLSNAHAKGVRMHGRTARVEDMLAVVGDTEQGSVSGRFLGDLPKEMLQGGEVDGDAS